MKLCKTCKYWTRMDSPVYTPWEGRCSSGKFVESSDPTNDGLQYWDYEGYSAGFSTGENFGCIHWEAK